MFSSLLGEGEGAAQHVGNVWRDWLRGQTSSENQDAVTKAWLDAVSGSAKHMTTALGMLRTWSSGDAPSVDQNIIAELRVRVERLETQMSSHMRSESSGSESKGPSEQNLGG